MELALLTVYAHFLRTIMMPDAATSCARVWKRAAAVHRIAEFALPSVATVSACMKNRAHPVRRTVEHVEHSVVMASVRNILPVKMGAPASLASPAQIASWIADSAR